MSASAELLVFSSLRLYAHLSQPIVANSSIMNTVSMRPSITSRPPYAMGLSVRVSVSPLGPVTFNFGALFHYLARAWRWLQIRFDFKSIPIRLRFGRRSTPIRLQFDHLLWTAALGRKNINRLACLRLAGYLTMTLMTFDK